jgi:hypothetical protein
LQSVLLESLDHLRSEAGWAEDLDVRGESEARALGITQVIATPSGPEIERERESFAVARD